MILGHWKDEKKIDVEASKRIPVVPSASFKRVDNKRSMDDRNKYLTREL